ncbi:hypothetical protein HDF16_001205 [Granulicella aggregans]|uniref:Uncharacterized protein n=1 Tax=Granulicella aggregans TaxID=474949 RepID=A0A7W7ZAX9_9BACT|nr:hypothetical protein [Granulicella aggregans]MBB5056520.1 hypothetical protein [Granulicella aggregans]
MEILKKPLVILTVLLVVVSFGSVVLVLSIWRDSYAVLYAILGAAVGWCAGILVAPFPKEVDRFAKFSKTLSAFISGYLISKLETVWGFITDEQHREIFFNPIVQRRFFVCVTCFFLVAAAVFKSRSYLHTEPDV